LFYIIEIIIIIINKLNINEIMENKIVDAIVTDRFEEFLNLKKNKKLNFQQPASKNIYLLLLVQFHIIH
jgi:hypothetical protein